MKKRILSLVLVFAMLLSCVPNVFAADSSGWTATDGPLGLTETVGDVETGFAAGANALTKYESSGMIPFSENKNYTAYSAEDMVTFIVVMEDAPLLESYSADEIARQTWSVKRHEKNQLAALDEAKADVTAAFGQQEGFAMGFTYTVATTGFSVTTRFGNKAALEAMDGVKSVYVAPTFSLPEDGMEDVASPYTNNASTMIGSDILNTAGFTGKGMRIAILDTGIMVDHPNFAALPESALVDPMTRESVEKVWDTLNASEMTTMLNVSYVSNKIPYVFNYDAGNFNVANTYAGSDHGTHVAGIAAANKVAGSNVVGVAPDAQLVVMQVFQQGGGASWDTIMAALEDCVRLEVDAANLSLGAAAGFSDPVDDMLETLNLFLESDIQVLIASGNDTNNAYMNAWGLDMSLLENPDIGLTGTPGTYSAALSVASVDNDGYEQMYITAGGMELGFQDTAVTAETSFINNFRKQTLEYVVVPGVGAEEDYEGLDVTGKVALVSRGTTSFPEKQAMAQSKGAIGCVIYNNDIGIFLMQINDGAGNIPAVSISQASGLYLIEQAGDDGIGSFTVCDADMKVFHVDRTVSLFSSWGVTPDLKLKPEIAGVGGSIYATVDPAISGSYYGYMSGTSMATPQITGAMAVLIQYLDETYPELTGAQQRQVAASILMSTANPIMATGTLEYSPRAQGAGLADLVKATTTPAYLSNPAASEGRPKAELGDDPEKTGVYEFSFVINNLSGEELTYTFDSSVLTEAIYADYFIANAPYGLEAKVALPDSVTVPANGSVTVDAKLTLTESDKAYLSQFPNGIYVEGYLYATPETGAEGEQAVTLTMPMVGFYGDWSDADIFDSHSLQNEYGYSLYPTAAFTYMAQLGTNPYFRGGASGDQYNAFSYANPLAEVDFAMLRNAKRLDITVTNAVTGEQYHYLDGIYMTKTHFNTSYGMIVPTMLMVEYGEIWDGKDANGKLLPDGTTITYKFEAWLDDGDDVMDDSWSFNATLDTVAPELVNADALQSALRIDESTGRSYLSLEILENQHVAALIFQSESGAVMGKYELANVPGQTLSGEYEITGFGSEFTIVVADYACNESEYDVMLDLGDQNNAVPKPAQLDKDRLYGNETFDGAAVEGGWFSTNKADFSDPRNETFDSTNRYYSAEFVNGYIIAQSAATGHLELVTPTGSYWSTQVLAENRGNVGDPNVWVLYDMALDHSGTLAASYGVNWETDATDALLAVGWLYQGDQDNDGKDDGYNALFNIKFTNYGSVNVQAIGRISGTDGAELLTLGITTEGDIYGIATNGILYSVGKTTEWDDSIGQGGDYVVKCTEIGTTDFVAYPGYGGTNVIQSMGYDHNTGTMYWYAHSQVPNGYYYDNINVTYTVNLETGKCTEVGSYGPGGQTCLFVPNELESDLFNMGAVPTNMQIDPYQKTMVAGQKDRLKIKWTPWNAAPAAVTWASSDENIVTVDQYGFVTAVAEGTAYIYASAEMMLDGYWEVIDGNWTWVDPAPGTKTVECMVTVVASEDNLYGYVVEDFGNPSNNVSWFAYSDKDPHDITFIGKQYLTGTDMDGNEYSAEPLWAGGTYYNGYIYSVASDSWVEDNVIYSGTKLYRSKVTKGATAAETTIGEPELIGVVPDMLISALAFDYNTGRMYCVENQNVGGLGIIDLETGNVDMLGHPNGDLSGGVYIPGLCVTRDGTIVISDAVANLYTIDPDTLTTKMIHQGSGSPYTAFFEAMTYDYNTDAIYWNMCDGNGESPLYMVLMPEYEWEQATLVDLGDVSSKYGTQQTIIFAIPDEEPETNVLPVESIDITNGDSVVGLEGGSLKLETVTVPARPTVQTKTWTSSDESVVTVDAYGNLTYMGVGTATVTVSITNKDEATYGGPFTDTITVTVLESAGEFVAFLNSDEGGTGYYDFWLKGNDYDLIHTIPTESMIAIYSLRSGTYYDGYFYAYSDKGQFLRIAEDDPANYKILGTVNLDTSAYQVTAMAMDYTTGTMYGLTLPSNYSLSTWSSEQHPGELVTIDLNTGKLTTVATLDFSTPVYALACDADGQLYAAGGSFDYYATSTNLYKMDKETGALTAYAVIEDANIYTGNTYYGTVQYNTQMTYDFGTDRLYLYATTDSYSYYESYAMYMVQLDEEPSVANLGKMSLYTRSGSDIKYGSLFLGLLAFVPEEDEIPAAKVNGIILNTSAARIPVGDTLQLTAQARPSNAADQSVTYSSSDPSVATVDENGQVTGVSVGTAIITVTSNETGVTATCLVTVIQLDGPQNVAYTVSARKDALISFNPTLPGQTASVVCTLSGGNTIKGMAYGDNCLYYLQYSNYSNYLYRFDFTTKQSTLMGQLYTFSEPSGLAYDKDNNLFYVTGGFYLFQFDGANLDPASSNYYTNSMLDSDYCTLTGVAVVDGAVYTFGNDFYTSAPKMIKYSDKYLSDRTVMLEGFDMSLVPGATDIAYEPNSGLFYMADAGHTIYAMDMEGNVVNVGLLGDGIDMHGLAIDPTGKYTITFSDGVDGEEIFADTNAHLLPGDKVLSGYAGTPVRTGYTFAGWVDADGNVVTDETLVNGNTTYYATWTANTYTITLIAFNGQPDVTITVAFGAPVGEALVDPVKPGYTFNGWFLADGITQYTADTVYAVDGNTTLYATWSVNQYTVTLDANGGTMDAESTITVTYDKAIGTLPVPTKDGYTFIGWMDADGNKVLAETIYTVDGDSTLTAQWSANAYTITLVPGEGATVDPAAVNVVFGAAVNTLPVPVKTGYTFNGWFDADGNLYTADTVYAVTGDITLTAAWTANTYTITLDDGNGNETTVTVTYGQPIGTLPEPAKDGYTFGGWVDADGNVYTAETVYAVDGDLELTAVWTANSYTITLDDGNGNKTTVEVTYGQPIGTLPEPVKDGYTFGGWFDADGNKYTAETIYNVDGNLELTAAWTRDPIPETGDATPIAPLVILLAVSACGLVVLLLMKKRKQN
ncbi:MAG: InlB B-repeat-containing protein [Oscillospiraceae bacterium]|nr:InlB B-repeat-containing protein [Oscillospiraceae bacterium]